MKMRSLFALPLALLVSMVPLAVQAQPLCYSSYNINYGVRSTCGSTPMVITAIPCVGCTFTWSGGPLVAGQGTPTATFQWNLAGGWGQATAYLDLDVYNPGSNCVYGEIWDVSAGGKPNIALPALSNGPWNGDTSKTWIYTRSYLNPMGIGNVEFFPTWIATNGTVVRDRHVLTGPFYYDSVFVKWQGPSGMALNESQMTTHHPPILLTYSCNWAATPTPIPNPSLAIFYNGMICTGGTKNFFTFPYPNSTYTWSITSGSVLSGQGTNSANILVTAPGTVTVVRDSAGTLSSVSINVTPTPAVVNLGPDQTVCAGTAVTLDAGPGFTQYQWSTGATTQSIQVTTAGSYQVTASSSGCSASDTVQILHLPVLTTNLGPDIHTCSFPVTLDAGPGFSAYNWSTGATTQTISVGTAGSYRVTVTNANGCADADTVVVYNSQTTVNLPSTLSFCHPGSVLVQPSYTNATTYLWSTGATTSSITWTTGGSQSVWVQASNSYGCQASDTVVVTSLPRPTPNLGSDQTVCPGASATFNAGSGYASYLWSNFLTTQSITTATAGTYRVTVTAANGCTGSDTVQLLNHPFTAPNLGPDINVCQPNATLDAGPGYATYLWNTGATTQTISVSTGGAYSVTVTSANGCTGTDAINVSFNNVTFSLGPNLTVCEPQTILLDPQLSGNFTYSWSTGATSPTLSLTAPGTYAVTLTVNNAFGCTASSSVIATILPTPASMIGADTILCADTTITLDAGPGFSSYIWSTGATTQTITIPNGGVYYVTATAPNGCIRLDTALVSDLIDCVFPGDVNYDQAVDLIDVLALGTVVGMSGPARPGASLNWYGQRCQNWTWSVTSGVNAKQADTDGNGTITQADTLAIQLNYGNTHSRTGTVTGNQGSIRIVPVNTVVTAGDIAYYAVYLEDVAGGDLDSVHGLGLQLQWPTTGLDASGLVSVDFGPAWFAPSGNHMDFSRHASNAASMAVTRTSGTDTLGHGLVMTLAFQTDSSMAPGNTVTFLPQVTAATIASEDLTLRSPLTAVTPLQITGAVAVENPTLFHALVMPNPADEHIQVQVESMIGEGSVQMMNMLGQVMGEYPLHEGQRTDITTRDLPSGAYLLRFRTEHGSHLKRVVVQH